MTPRKAAAAPPEDDITRSPAFKAGLARAAELPPMSAATAARVAAHLTAAVAAREAEDSGEGERVPAA